MLNKTTNSSFNHFFHLVDASPWPLVSSLCGGLITLGLLKWFDSMVLPNLFIMSMFMTLILMFQWWNDVSKEGARQGLHSLTVEVGLRWGMALFICSEMMLFSSLFWAFFHSSLAPSVELALNWPPIGVFPLNPAEVPLLNTAILLSSGGSVTWAHHAIMESLHSEALSGLGLTIILGAYFSFLQGMEYWEAFFTISDSVYGSSFYMATGFHGLHVLIGTLFLMVCWLRAKMGSFSKDHHFGFVAASWYWHFVDVVWVFLFVTIYVWGGM